MKNKRIHIDEIKDRFEGVKSKQDLLGLINDVKQILYGDNFHPISLKALNYFANPIFCNNRYKSFSISKKNGGDRIINAPVKGLKHILRPLNLILQQVYDPHPTATGFVPGLSIAYNAKNHLGNHYVYNIDLKDFFHSFDRNRVKLGFMKSPFNLKDELEPIAFLLASLCTHPFEVDGEIKTVLPQGAPTSPTITNILCKTLDRRLNGLAKRFKINYSRYADDITFSSQTNVFVKKEFLKELNRIIEDQKLVINEKKTRLQQSGYRQEVTGIVVNEKANVKTRYIKEIRMWMYYWEKYGYAKAEFIFKKDYIRDKGHIKKEEPNMVNVIGGKLEYLKMVKGIEDGTFKKLNQRFILLTKSSQKLDENKIELIAIADLVLKKGIDYAMTKYQKDYGES